MVQTPFAKVEASDVESTSERAEQRVVRAEALALRDEPGHPSRPWFPRPVCPGTRDRGTSR